MSRGRPLRFLALVLGGWVIARAAVLWLGAKPAWAPVRDAAAPPVATPPPTRVAEALPRAALRDESRGAGAMRGAAMSVPARQMTSQRVLGMRRRDVEGRTTREEVVVVEDGTQAVAATVPVLKTGDVGIASAPSTSVTTPAAPPSRLSARLSRLHGDTWLIARPSGGDSLAFGQLGASQAGMRVTYAIDATRHVALSARLSAPLRGFGREAAVGLDWRPTRLPIHLLAEERIPIERAAARPALQLIGGTTVRLPMRLVAESYGQAGGVYRRGGFADGSVRVSRVLASRSKYTLDLGAGAWGAAQRRVSRLDLGPTLGLTLPARGGTVRLAVDYRLRVAGRARPGSGPAVSLGSSF